MDDLTQSRREPQTAGKITNTMVPLISTIKILLANDENLVREGLRLVLCEYPEFSISATTLDRSSVLQQILLHRPDIVLIGFDPHISGTDVIETTRIILRRHTQTKIVILASSPHLFHIHEAFRAGAHGYLSKNIDKNEFRASLRAVYHEGAVLSHGMASHVLRMVSGHPIINSDPLSNLSKKEREILFMMAHGYDASHIAVSLSLSPKTVRNYFSRIYAKLGTGDRLRTVLYARSSFARSARPDET